MTSTTTTITIPSVKHIVKTKNWVKYSEAVQLVKSVGPNLLTLNLSTPTRYSPLLLTLLKSINSSRLDVRLVHTRICEGMLPRRCHGNALKFLEEEEEGEGSSSSRYRMMIGWSLLVDESEGYAQASYHSVIIDTQDGNNFLFCVTPNELGHTLLWFVPDQFYKTISSQEIHEQFEEKGKNYYVVTDSMVFSLEKDWTQQTADKYAELHRFMSNENELILDMSVEERWALQDEYPILDTISARFSS